MLHPEDLFQLMVQQITQPMAGAPITVNLGGGIANTLSLAELDAYCKQQIDANKPIATIQENRPYDIPFYSTDYSLAKKVWNWEPRRTSTAILAEILAYAYAHPEWLRAVSE